jgi:hypothetical protein
MHAEFEGKMYRHDTCMSVVCAQSKEFVYYCLQRRTEPGGGVGSVDTKQAGHVVRTGGRERHTTFRWGNVKERDNLEDLDRNGRVILAGWERVRWINLA